MNLFKSVLFPVLIIIGFQLANTIAIAIEALISVDKTMLMWSILKWSVVGLIAWVNAILITGIGILAHDGVHTVFFRKKIVNELLNRKTTLQLVPHFITKGGRCGPTPLFFSKYSLTKTNPSFIYLTYFHSSQAGLR